MANGLLDLLGGLGTTPPSYLEGLLGAQPVEDLRKRSIGTGIANALIGYLATPKNQNLGLGRILANTAQAGMQGAQGVYDTATADYMQAQKIEEMQRAKEQRTAQLEAINQVAQSNPQLGQVLKAYPQAAAGVLEKMYTQKEAKPRETAFAPNGQLVYKDTGDPVTEKSFAAPPSNADLTNDRNAVAFANFGGKRFSELTPPEAKQVNDYIENSKVRVAGAGIPSQQPSFQDATKIREEFKSNPVVKAFNTQESAYKIIKSTMTNPSAAGDLAGVTKFMKLLDPESVVRESEVGLARNATGLYDKLKNYYETISTG